MRNTNVKGLRELEQAMKQFPDKLQKSIVRSGLRAAGKVIEKEAKALVPVKTGTLRNSIKTTSGTKDGQPFAIVTAGSREDGGGGAFYAAMVEFGTASHLISATGAVYKQTRRGPKQLSVGSINDRIKKGVLAKGSTILGRTVEHPGSAPRPFFRPAIDKAIPAAVQDFAETIRRRLKKEGALVADVPVGDAPGEGAGND